MTRIQGTEHLDRLLSSGFDTQVALGELAMMVEESSLMIHQQMQNVPESVRRSLYLMTMAIGTIATILRSFEAEGHRDRR